MLQHRNVLFLERLVVGVDVFVLLLTLLDDGEALATPEVDDGSSVKKHAV